MSNPTPDTLPTIDEILNTTINLSESASVGETTSAQFDASMQVAKHQLEQLMARERNPILNALNDMYSQYCAGRGHLFMGAGEDASEILEKYGYIEVDGAGRVTKDLQSKHQEKR